MYTYIFGDRRAVTKQHHSFPANRMIPNHKLIRSIFTLIYCAVYETSNAF